MVNLRGHCHVLSPGDAPDRRIQDDRHRAHDYADEKGCIAVTPLRFADGTTAHNVTVDMTTSPTLTTGTWTHQFTQPGTFPYFCPLHPFMKASITVT